MDRSANMAVQVQQQKEVIALLTWLESFPSFTERVLPQHDNDDDDTTIASINTNALQLLQSLDRGPVLSSVRRVAAEILDEEWNENENEPFMRNSSLPSSAAQQVWQSLLEKSSRLARPDSFNETEMAMEYGGDKRAILKIRVLSNMLDCVVNHPNLQARRQYIGRVLKLSKTTQRRLMTMIEKRLLKSNPNQAKKSPTRSTSRSPRKSLGAPRPILRSDAKYSSGSASAATMENTEQDDGNYYSSRPARQTTNPTSPTRSRNGYSPGAYTPNNPSTPMDETTSRNSSASATNTAGQRSLMMTPTGAATPSSTVDFLSPTQAMDSPAMAHQMIHQLQRSNKKLQAQIEQYQQRELSLQSKDDNHRQDMMKLESTYLNRQQELEDEHKEQILVMRSRMEEMERERQEGLKAKEDLKLVQDEMELAKHSVVALNEAKERIRGYRVRIEELQDVRDALEREEEAHARAVEDVVKLQNEVQSLLPAKRQLEEYKTRAIEAEVKLVECQESLRRLELEMVDANEEKSGLFQQSRMQRQQLDEMVQRIQQDTQRSIDSASGGGLGEGVSELNPNVKSELTRLRNENLQLRAFAAKRQDDAVDQLESKLDDSKRLSEKYKQEYLNIKDQLLSTQTELRNTEKKLDNCMSQLRHVEKERDFLTTELDGAERTLKQTQEELESAETMKNKLLQDVKQLTESLHTKKELVQQQQIQLEELTHRVTDTESALETAERERTEFQDMARSWEANAKAMEDEVVNTQNELERAEEQIGSLQKSFQEERAKLKTAEKQVREVEARLEEEKETNEKANEATRHILTTRYNQQLQDQSTQFSRLLEEEKESLAQAEKEKADLEVQYNHELEELTQALAAKDKELIEKSQKMEEERKATKDRHLNVVREGKAYITDLKERTTAEMESLNQQKIAVEKEFQRVASEKAEMEENARMTISSLKGQLADSQQENDELEERCRTLKDGNEQLGTENGKLKRQVLGGNGRGSDKANEQMRQEMERVLQENRQLRRQLRENGDGVVADQEIGGRYRSGGATQMRQEYEEQIVNLNDEKRGLILKYNSALTEVQKAEKRTYERDEEITQLKAKVTSMELKLERAELSEVASSTPYSTSANSSRSPTPTSPTRTKPKASLPAPKTPPSAYSRNAQRLRSSPSPTIDRAKRQKDKTEQMLRSHISTLRRTPTKLGFNSNDGNDGDAVPHVKRVLSIRPDPSNNYGSRRHMMNAQEDEHEERRDDDLSASSYSMGQYQPKYRTMTRSQGSGQYSNNSDYL